MIKEIKEYIEGVPAEHRPTLTKVYNTLRQALPDAEERISYRMPTFWQGENLVHFALARHHIGIYAGGSASEHFKDRLTSEGYKFSKGAIQFSLAKPIDYDFIREIAEFRLGVALKLGGGVMDGQTGEHKKAKN